MLTSTDCPSEHSESVLISFSWNVDQVSNKNSKSIQTSSVQHGFRCYTFEVHVLLFNNMLTLRKQQNVLPKNVITPKRHPISSPRTASQNPSTKTWRAGVSGWLAPHESRCLPDPAKSTGPSTGLSLERTINASKTRTQMHMIFVISTGGSVARSF